MIHPEHQRRAYLQAMGIDVWLPRDGDEPGLVEQPAVSVEGLGWDDLRECVANCTRCELSQSRTNTVFGVGNPEADWLIIGEAPGAEEDRRGEPFVGRAGQLLDQMLLAIGQSRDSVFIANILKCRPPNNRDPKPDEAAACRAYCGTKPAWRCRPGGSHARAPAPVWRYSPGSHLSSGVPAAQPVAEAEVME
jgi:DNA polymerase